MFNKCVFVGRITFDLNLKMAGETPYVVNSLAVKRAFQKDDIADFIPFKVWGKSAEYLVNYAKKGDLVLICGVLRIENFQNKDGENRKSYYINCESVNILQTKKNTSEPSNESSTEDGDLPF